MNLDPATLEACKRGDAHAFRRLVELHERPVHGLCVALAGAADGEDLAQETFLRVYKAIRGFDPAGPATLRAWILTIARRLCADRARHVNLGVEVAAAAGGVLPDAADPAADPEALLGAAGLQARLRRAVAALPEEQRAVLVLREIFPRDLRLVFLNYPLPGHKHAELAAEAALAAGAQGKFWEMHDLLFAGEDGLDRPAIDGYARALGLDLERFQKDLDGHRFAARVAHDRQVADGFGLQGTPTFLVNGRLVRGVRDVSFFRGLVDEELAASRK